MPGMYAPSSATAGRRPYIYLYICTCTSRPYSHLHYIHTFTHSHIHTFIHSHIHTFTHSYIHTFTHSYIHTFTHSHIRITFALHSHIRTFVNMVRTYASRLLAMHFACACTPACLNCTCTTRGHGVEMAHTDGIHVMPGRGGPHAGAIISTPCPLIGRPADGTAG
jgi:hypothetical protein